jgi:hypothetical protein
LPGNFGDTGENDLKVSLPSDLVNEDEIKEFLSKLKLFVDQPNEGSNRWDHKTENTVNL